MPRWLLPTTVHSCGQREGHRGCRFPVSNPSTSRATIQSASKSPPPHTQGTMTSRKRRETGTEEKKPRVGEPPGDRVGTTERGRGRARAWHTRVTERQRQRRRSEKNRQEPQRDGGWEGKRGGERGVAWRRAGNTRRARVSSDQRDWRGTRKKKEIKVRQGTKKGQTEGVGPRGRRGMQGANKSAKVHIVSHRKSPCR